MLIKFGRGTQATNVNCYVAGLHIVQHLMCKIRQRATCDLRLSEPSRKL